MVGIYVAAYKKEWSNRPLIGQVEHIESTSVNIPYAPDRRYRQESNSDDWSAFHKQSKNKQRTYRRAESKIQGYR